MLTRFARPLLFATLLLVLGSVGCVGPSAGSLSGLDQTLHFDVPEDPAMDVDAKFSEGVLSTEYPTVTMLESGSEKN